MFDAANRHRVAFAAVSGGLFVGGRVQPIAAYPHIPDANARIARLTGAVFCDAYNRLLKGGQMVMDSLDAAQALRDLQSGVGKAQAQADFALARQLGEQSYPTLLVEDGDQVHQLPGTGMSLGVLNGELDVLLG